MGSYRELNDPLQITTEQGFPAFLDLERHRKSPITFEELKEKGLLNFEFKGKLGARDYHTPPTRNFLVHNIDGKWLYWGKVLVIRQTIEGESEDKQMTSGKCRIIQIYKPDYQIEITMNESPEGMSYF